MAEQKEIKDSGQRTEYANGFVRDMHEGKGRFDLMPWYAIWELAKHCEAGAKKYGERNIDLGCPQHSLIDSAFRHLAKYTLGMDDEDHLRAALWNIAWAVQQDVIMPEMQDIPARMKTETDHSFNKTINLLESSYKISDFDGYQDALEMATKFIEKGGEQDA